MTTLPPAKPHLSCWKKFVYHLVVLHDCNLEGHSFGCCWECCVSQGFVILFNTWNWLQVFIAITYAVTRPVPTPWKQERSQKSFCTLSPVQGFIAFDFAKLTGHMCTLLTYLWGSICHSDGRCDCYPLLFQWVTLHLVWDCFSRKGKNFFTSSSSSAVSTFWGLQCFWDGFENNRDQKSYIQDLLHTFWKRNFPF